MRKLRLREVKVINQGHTAKRHQDSHPGLCVALEMDINVTSEVTRQDFLKKIGLEVGLKSQEGI